MTDQEMFYGKCPYTDHPCHNFWDCGHCEWATCQKMEVDK